MLHACSSAAFIQHRVNWQLYCSGLCNGEWTTSLPLKMHGCLLTIINYGMTSGQFIKYSDLSSETWYTKVFGVKEVISGIRFVL